MVTIRNRLERRGASDGITATQATGWLRDHSTRIMTAGVILALLYLARSILIPLALAIVLSLLVAPLIRALRRLRIGKTSSVLIAVAALTVLCVGVTAALGTQILHIAESLPQYESNVQRKLKTLEEATVDPILRLTNETSRLTGIRQPREADSVPARDVERSPPEAAPGVAVIPPPEFGSHPLLLVWKLLTTVWHPIQFAGIVLLVLIFVLLEYESLRDRFILIAGATDIRTATLALIDAGDRLSRYFVSQFAVNLAFGAGHLDELERASPPAGPALRNSGRCDAVRTLRGCCDSSALCCRPCSSRRSRMVFGAERLGRIHPTRHRRGAVGGTAPLWSRHGTVAALGSGGSIILELALGSGRADTVHANHRVPPSCGSSHEGTWRPRVAIGQWDDADIVAEVSPAGGGARRSARNCQRCAGFWAGRHRPGVVAHSRDAGTLFFRRIRD
jgi:hypothetical protein